MNKKTCDKIANSLQEVLAKINDISLEVVYPKVAPIYLSVCQDGWLGPSNNNTPLTRVAYIQTAPGYAAVAKELQASLVTAEAVRAVCRDPALKKLSAASREALEVALAGIE